MESKKVWFPATESYCRAWLSGKVKTNPSNYKQQFAQAAWLTLSIDIAGSTDSAQ
ncbi:hypothetical protein [Acinetobacter gandensis]|uniref:hypothetical protein n=1 Tax=Acinetobacter gandensis TaxID=1443941 RepID=UPI003988B7FD